MSNLIYLIAIALLLGLLGLVAFLWALRSGQFEDLDGAANRILFDDDDPPSPPVGTPGQKGGDAGPEKGKSL
ncbi:MAG: cbb3-type cytochrome oxidase assembly protein CcoS [Rhodospirillales bacterium]|nr:cbb3-type cytochrome oxidase assembly protein CcoS [Rhodospirillales bacterium]